MQPIFKLAVRPRALKKRLYLDVSDAQGEIEFQTSCSMRWSWSALVCFSPRAKCSLSKALPFCSKLFRKPKSCSVTTDNTTNGCAAQCWNVASPPSSRQSPTEKLKLRSTGSSRKADTKSKTRLAGSKTGNVLTPLTSATPTLSCQLSQWQQQ